MAATELLKILALLLNLTCSAFSFCWKPNINPFMGANHNLLNHNHKYFVGICKECRWKLLLNQKVPPIQNGLICQQCGSVGMTSFQRALLAKRFCVCTNHLLPFPQPGGLPGQVHIKSTKSTSNPPGGLPDQVSPPWRAFQLQTLRSHTQGFIIKWRGCHLSQGSMEHYI